MASLAELDARVAALEADRADYRAVLAAVGVLAQRVGDADVRIGAHRQAVNAWGEKVSGFQAEGRERFDTINRNRAPSTWLSGVDAGRIAGRGH